MAEAAAPQGIESFIEEIVEERSMENQSPGFRSNLNSPSSQFGGQDMDADGKDDDEEGEDVNADGKDDDDEEALLWAVIEKLPSYKRMRASILKEYDEDGGQLINRRVVDVGHLKPLERHLLIEKLVTNSERDNKKFLRKLKDRIDRVGIELPTVEVRYQNLNVDAECHIGSRNLPTLWNVTRNVLEGVLETMHLSLSKKAELSILKDVNGLIKPSRITLLLGPPGCGKTTLLQALAGKLDPTLKTRGNTSYNGFQLNEFIPQTTSAYISQHDLHFAEMTVRETFDFSARCQGVGTSYDLLFEIRKREKEAGILPEADIDTYMKATAIEGLKGSLQTDYILKILGLNICADIMIGDAMRRGISGGQRKRVTTGEMILSPMKTLFMDEISTGLDSSTTFQVVKCLQQVAHIKQATIVMSLLQPAPETFDLFDDVILMSEGQIVYHGPRDHVLEFFEYCGFMCPERKGIADFLQEVTSRKNQELYWEDREKPYRYISVEQFSQKFKQFHVGQKLIEELSKPFDKSKGHKAALSFSKYSLRKWELFKACFDREWLLFKRNSFLHIFKATQLVVVALIVMSLFYRTHMQVDLEHGNYYLGSLFFSLTTMTFIGLPEIPITIRRFPVFFKQRDLYFYPAWAYTLPGILLKIPLSLFDALIWTSITYYGIGYSPEAGRFFRQFLVWFCINQTATALFRATAAVCRSIVVANTGGSLVLVFVGIFSGFLIPPSSIPKWWRWGLWFSPMYYGETAITVNEFLAPRWRKLTSQNTSLGIEVLESRGLFHEDYFYWIGLGSLIGFTVLLNVGYTLALTYLNPIGKPQAVISREKLAKIQYSQEDRNFDLHAESNTISSRHPPVSCTERSQAAELLLPDFTSASKRRGSFDFTNASKRRGSFCKDSSSTKRGMILSFHPFAISFQNIQYSVDMPVEMKERGETEKRLHLLKDITGAFRPGVLTALMGVSGAGKTTLMDVLAGRKTGGHIEGDIRISGFPKVQETFTRISGYCEQNDIHSPQVTVHESLLFSSWLRLAPEIDSKTKKNFVSQVMQLIELDGLKDALVGIPGVSGLTTEQRKRLTIAVELVANPSIIFMDEPTSGLDARAAAIVMRAVRNIVDTGRTVVCTIHQSSIDIFEAFDELLLMKRGGEIIYSGALGHHSKNMIKYFEAIRGVPNIKDKYNPATWMLEVTSTGAEQRLSVDFAQIYKESTLFWENNELIKELCTPAPDAKDLYFPDDYAQCAWKQFTTSLWKQFWAYWRSPGYNLVRLTFSSFTALLFGIIYWQQGTKINDQEDLLKMMGAMYGAMLFIGINNGSSVQPFVDVERKVFYREKAARLYSPLVYALAQVVVELLYTLFQTILYGIITYSVMGFHWSGYKFFWYLFVTLCTFLLYTYFGMMTVAISSNAQVAAIIASAFYNIFNLFSGFLITRPQFPGWWVWYYWICPLSWTMNGLITSQYGDMRKKISVEGKPQQAIEDFLKDYFGFQRDFLGVVAAVLVIFPVLFALSFCISISRLNFQKR